MELTSVFFVLSVIFAVGSTTDQLEWENCDSSAPILVANLTILPYPISLEEGVKLRIKATINIKYTVSLKIEKKFLAWYPTIPCVASIGSWGGITRSERTSVFMASDYDIGLKKIPTQTIEIPDISVPAFLTNGKYRVRADIREDKTKNRLFCIKASFTIDS